MSLRLELQVYKMSVSWYLQRIRKKSLPRRKPQLFWKKEGNFEKIWNFSPTVFADFDEIFQKVNPTKDLFRTLAEHPVCRQGPTNQCMKCC